MRGGSRKSMVELGAAATYATWYFGSVNDPFGTGARTASIARKTASKQAKLRARTFRGEVRRARAAGPLAPIRCVGAAPVAGAAPAGRAARAAGRAGRGRASAGDAVRAGARQATQGASRARMSSGIGFFVDVAESTHTCTSRPRGQQLALAPLLELADDRGVAQPDDAHREVEHVVEARRGAEAGLRVDHHHVGALATIAP